MKISIKFATLVLDITHDGSKVLTFTLTEPIKEVIGSLKPGGMEVKAIDVNEINIHESMLNYVHLLPNTGEVDIISTELIMDVSIKTKSVWLTDVSFSDLANRKH